MMIINSDVTLIIIFYCYLTNVNSFKHENVCHYNYNYQCALQINKHVTSFSDDIKLCTLKDVPNDVNFTIMSDDKNSSSRGVMNVDLKSPSTNCKYKVSLFVNSKIDNSNDCKNYVFNKDNRDEIHTLDKTICPIEKNDPIIENTTVNTTDCKSILNMWFEYIYTGCFALGFKINEDYIFIGNEFLKTEYKKIEVQEPKLRCSYKSIFKENESSVKMMKIALDVSLLAGSSGIRLEVAPKSLTFKDDDDACNKYTKNPLISHFVGMSVENDTDAVDDRCTLTTNLLSNGELTKTIECNFFVENLSKDTGYCLLVRVLDERCQKNTSWKPPSKDKVPCAWTQHCQKTIGNMVDGIEELKNNKDTKILKMSLVFYTIVFLTIVLILMSLTCIIFITCRSFVKRKKTLLNGKVFTEDFENDTVLELNDGIKSQNEKLINESGIVILYLRESEQFMLFMSQFKKILEKQTGCKIYDWWAPEFWNDVASLGGYEWVVKMIKKNFRILWMDTLNARRLFLTNRKNRYNFIKKSKRSENNFEIGDHRESIFTAIVDFAKRNSNLEQEYQRHFVVRLETFVNADKTEDPFADLSPHVRYLIPCHLDKICRQLSIINDYLDEIDADKNHLEKYLYQETILNL